VDHTGLAGDLEPDQDRRGGAPLMGAVAYLTLWERKAIGFTQVRGPQPHGPAGLLQPIADALKLLTKEIIHPRPPTRACSSWARS
jgi:NADH:ubiquinone oxidoreductase subunit H